MDYWILNDAGEPVREPDVRKWGEWFERAQTDATRVLAQDRFGDDVMVSTVFLALDHSWGFDGSAPVLWETMIFGGPLGDSQWRYTSRDAALAAHAILRDVLERLTGNAGVEEIKPPRLSSGPRAIYVRVEPI